MPEGEPTNTVGLLAACRELAGFTSIAEEAGPNLADERFPAALDGHGDITLPGTRAGSIRAGEHDTEDDLRLSIPDPDAADEADCVEFTGWPRSHRWRVRDPAGPLPRSHRSSRRVRPVRRAITTSCARSRAWSLVIARLTWVFAVRGDM